MAIQEESPAGIKPDMCFAVEIFAGHPLLEQNGPAGIRESDYG
jgi:hypothetical protein